MYPSSNPYLSYMYIHPIEYRFSIRIIVLNIEVEGVNRFYPNQVQRILCTHFKIFTNTGTRVEVNKTRVEVNKISIQFWKKERNYSWKNEEYSEDNACKQDEKRTFHHIFVPSCTKCSKLLSKKHFAITIEIAQLSSIMIHLPILHVKDSITKLRSTPSFEANYPASWPLYILRWGRDEAISITNSVRRFRRTWFSMNLFYIDHPFRTIGIILSPSWSWGPSSS